MYYIYMLRCKDDSIYTGITTDVQRRFKKHLKGMGAKYTKVHKPEYIECVFEAKNRSDASKIEYAIKQLSKAKKEALIKTKDLSKWTKI